MTHFLYFTHIFGFTRSFRLVFTFNFIFFRSCWGTGQGPRSKDLTHRAEKGRNLEYQKEEAGYKYVATSGGGYNNTFGRRVSRMGGGAGRVGRGVKMANAEYHISPEMSIPQAKESRNPDVSER